MNAQKTAEKYYALKQQPMERDRWGVPTVKGIAHSNAIIEALSDFYAATRGMSYDEQMRFLIKTQAGMPWEEIN